MVDTQLARCVNTSGALVPDFILRITYMYYMYEIVYLALYKTLLFRPRVFSRALGCGARRGDPPVHHGARVGPRRAP